MIFTTSAIDCSLITRPVPRRLPSIASIPGNVGFKDKKDKQFAEIVEMAIRHDKPVRIGVNWGSLDQELLNRLMDPMPKTARRCRPPGDP